MRKLTNGAESAIINTGGEYMINIADEKRKILDGTYCSKIIVGRQNKHIEGTREFAQNRDKMKRLSPGSEPSILDADAHELIEKYKGTGMIDVPKGSEYPRETVDTDRIVGKTWVQSMRKYADTKRIKIFYSSAGVHIVPVSDHEKG